MTDIRSRIPPASMKIDTGVGSGHCKGRVTKAGRGMYEKYPAIGQGEAIATGTRVYTQYNS